MSTFETFLGVPWACPCNPPLTYDCWAFAQAVRRDIYQRRTPDPVPLADRHKGSAADFRDMTGWVSLVAPEPGCMVLLGNPATHCGVYVGRDTVGHCASPDFMAGMSRYDNLWALARLYGSISFWEIPDA